jgi:hypothetical protein
MRQTRPSQRTRQAVVTRAPVAAPVRAYGSLGAVRPTDTGPTVLRPGPVERRVDTTSRPRQERPRDTYSKSRERQCRERTRAVERFVSPSNPRRQSRSRRVGVCQRAARSRSPARSAATTARSGEMLGRYAWPSICAPDWPRRGQIWIVLGWLRPAKGTLIKRPDQAS